MDYPEALNLMWKIDGQIDDLRSWLEESAVSPSDDARLQDHLSALTVASDQVIQHLRNAVKVN